jgi:hypothetical protein
VLLNPLSFTTTCELWLAAAVLWYYCKSNVPLKWPFTKLLMKCIVNMLVSGWLGKLTTAYFPYCHTGRHAEGKPFKCDMQPVSHLVRTGGWWGQSFREITWSCSFKSCLTHNLPNPLLFPLALNFSLCFPSNFLSYQVGPHTCSSAWSDNNREN